MSAIEMAEHSPKLAILRAIQALMKAGRMDEAEQLMRDLYQMEMSEQGEVQGAGMEQPRTEEPPPVMGGEVGAGPGAVSLPEETPPTIGVPPAIPS